MIVELCIEHLGVIERVQLPLGPGLTAVTGETGAGKTMLVEAIELVVGGRADATVVGAAADEARVDARLVVGDDETVLTRVVPRSGRSRAYVDGRPTTAAALVQHAGPVIDLHGQHADQRLLTVATQRSSLDAYGAVDLAPLRAARGRVAELDAELATLGGDERARAREIDLLEFQVAELDGAAVDDPDEDARLEREEAVLADAAAHRMSGAFAVERLAADGGARDALGSALAELDGRAPFDDVRRRLADVLAELDDLASDLRRAVDDVVESPERLDEVRRRRNELRELCRKYGDDLAAVQAYHREAAERLDELRSHDARVAELSAARETAVDAVDRAARAVGARRREVAPRLAADVQEVLRTLALPHARFEITVDDQAGEHVEFLLAANPGTPALPLARVASGGELARVMLAVRLVLSSSDGDEPITLVFDEVDAGIGGAAATAVAAALAALGRRHQVLVVTHLAQVAAAASTHVHVVKTVERGVTIATASVLDDAGRVDEVARMLAGDTSGAARRHAAELLATHGSATPARRAR